MKLFSSALLALTITAFPLFAAGDGWLTDFEAAKKQAAAEHKSLLVDFTGSDWCGWCIKLDEQVFQKESFQEYVKDKFVLVELDFPQKTEQEAKLKEQNAKLQQEYKIQGFPTVLLMDATGRPYARTGYLEGGPEAYNLHLDELLKIKEGFNQAKNAADQLEGVEKANGYIAALKAIPVEFADFYQKEVEVIYASDPEDKSGFRKDMEINEKLNTLGQKVDSSLQLGKTDEALAAITTFIEGNEIPEKLKSNLYIQSLFIEIDSKVGEGKTDEAISKVDAFLAANAELPKATRQEVLGMKIDVYMTEEKFDKAEEVVDAIIAIDPESEISSMAKQFKPQIAKYKEYAESAKEEAKEATPAE